MTEHSMTFTRDLPLPDAFSRGQIVAFSGIAGENLLRRDFCGVLTGESGEIRFACGENASVLLRFTENAQSYDVVLPDLIAAQEGAVLVTFADAQTIVGRSDTTPAVRLEGESGVSGSRTVLGGEYAFSLATRTTDRGVVFAFCRRSDAETAEADAQSALSADADALAQQVLDWYQACPPCPNPHFEKLWYKCLSINRANVFTAQDGFTHSFTTPERPLHGDVRAADAFFLAPAMVHFAPALAMDAVLSALEHLHEDGAAPRGLQTPDDMQLPVLCATIRSLFEVTGDVALLRDTAEPLQRYLDRLLASQRSPNGLMARRTQRSGATDSRGDADNAQLVEALDLSVFTANELLCMHRMYQMLGNHAAALQAEGMYFDLAARINGRLWDDKSRCYYDRTLGGAFRRIPTTASFLPLYAGICDPRQAHCLAAHLRPLLDLPFPMPCASNEGVRLHENYYVYIGLQRYGFGSLAAVLRQKTLEGADKQFRDTGGVFDLYDPHGGAPVTQNTDCNRSAGFIELFLWG